MTEVIDVAAAEALALGSANASFGYPTEDDVIVILTDRTIETSFGWVFFYNTKSFVESGDVLKALMGNGPVLITRTGECIQIPSGMDVSAALSRFQRGESML